MLAALVTGRQRRGLRGLDRMDADARVESSQEPPDPHDGAAGSDACDEGIKGDAGIRELLEDLRTGRRLMGDRVGFVRELRREEYAAVFRCERLRPADAADESSLLAAHGDDRCAEACDQVSPLA